MVHTGKSDALEVILGSVGKVKKKIQKLDPWWKIYTLEPPNQ